MIVNGGQEDGGRKLNTGTKLSLLASLLSFCGCGQSAPTPKEPTLIEELAINGLDPDGEPIIKKWSDGTIRIYFEAMKEQKASTRTLR